MSLENITISFNVTINSPLPPGVTRIYNRGIISCNEVSPRTTDDPGTGGPTGTDIANPTPAPAVPTLSQWGMIAMATLFAAFLIWTARRKLTVSVGKVKR